MSETKEQAKARQMAIIAAGKAKQAPRDALDSKAFTAVSPRKRLA